MCYYFYDKKQAKVNFHPTSENSPNLVPLYDHELLHQHCTSCAYNTISNLVLRIFQMAYYVQHQRCCCKCSSRRIGSGSRYYVNVARYICTYL
jgi:hypothetical protein